MKRWKDDEIEKKLMGAMGPKPMFPRLHVNDTTDMGGPRAPPRNKMALYEQLAIPSHRFPHAHNPNNTTSPSLVPPPTQEGGSERNMLSSHRVPPRHQSEKHYSQHPDFRTPVGLVEQRKEVDEDDYSVPIFVHSVPSQELCSRTNNRDREELSPSNPSSKFRHANERGAMECSTRPEAKTQKGENTKIVSVPVKSISKCSFSDKTKELSAEPRQFSDKQNTAATNNRSSSLVLGALPAENQNIIHDPMYDLRSREDSSCRSPPTGNLERGDSVSETSVLDSLPGDITPDDVVGVIGQKHFWKARRAIANQQRVFAVQVFELHRLIKVQRLIAASPNLLHEDSAYSGEPIKASPRKKLQLDYTVKPLPNISKQKIDSEKQSHKKEGSAESTVEKVHLPSSQNRSPPTPLITDSPAPSDGGDQNGRQWCHHQPRPGQQWLIPVMSPSEGLVYKPYPGPGFAGQACGGCDQPGPNPMFGNFLAPAYGFPAPPPQYQLPSYPPPGPHSYFPPYGMQTMSTSAFSGSSVEQIKPPANLRHDSAPEGSLKIGPRLIPDPLNLQDVEVQASTGSSPIERRQVNQAVEERNMLSLFPTSLAAEAQNTGRQLPGPCPHPPRVIKVVPHNARTASESVARIFRSIQEERKQCDSA